MDIQRQTECMVVNSIMVDNFASFFYCTTVGETAISHICFRWLAPEY